jgi:hypothetical protein
MQEENLQNRHRAAQRGLVLAAAVFVTSGCSTGGQRLTQSGFLPEYTVLQKARSLKNTVIWISPGYDPGHYASIIVEPVKWLAPPREAKVEQVLRNDFARSLTDALSTGRRTLKIISSTPGAKQTLRVRSAITGMRRTRWFVNAPLQAVQLVAGGLPIFAPLQGGASEEIQVEDAATGQPLIQIATFHNGKPWNVKGSYVAYDHARAAFGKAAETVARVVNDPASVELHPSPGR